MTESIFADLALAPADAIFALTASYKADDFKDKVNLGVGAYRDNDGKPYVLPVVHKVGIRACRGIWADTNLNPGSSDSRCGHDLGS